MVVEKQICLDLSFPICKMRRKIAGAILDGDEDCVCAYGSFPLPEAGIFNFSPRKGMIHS